MLAFYERGEIIVCQAAEIVVTDDVLAHQRVYPVIVAPDSGLEEEPGPADV